MSNNDDAELPSLLDLLASTTGLDLESTQAQNYVKKLASLGLDDLKHEPAVVTNERSAVESELVNLCYREYPTFTSVHRCSAAVGSAFDDFDTSLGDLINSIPALEEECRQFSQDNAIIQASRRKAVLLQDHEDKLLNVLEVPQLMETCVRNGHYQEALDLAAHISNLDETMGVVIVSDVAREVDNVLQLMTAQLLGVLREPVKLPALLKAVNYLRRLRCLDDEDIALVFLSSRLHNYRARLVDIESYRAEPVRYLRKYVDLFREHVFDIISQYTTIFAGDIGTLPTFACLCVEDLVDLVRRYIPRIAADAASISSIMVQLGYCSLSFSRVGLDFSALLAEPFAATISSSFDQAVSSAAELIIETLSAPSTSPSTLLISTQHLSHVLADPNSPPAFIAGTDLHTPPSILAQYPPLAQLLNSHLASLNALRLLTPFQLGPALSTSQSVSLQKVTNALLAYVEEAVLEDTAPPLARAQSGSRHTRTGSTPRAQLIRRNTETQLSSETLLARRRETKRVCVAFANAWLHTIHFLRNGLAQVLEQPSLYEDPELRSSVMRIEMWIQENEEVEASQTEATAMPDLGEEAEHKSPRISPSITTDITFQRSLSPTSPASPTPQRKSVVRGNMSPPPLSLVSDQKASTANASSIIAAANGHDGHDQNRQLSAARQIVRPAATQPATEVSDTSKSASIEITPESEVLSSRPDAAADATSVPEPMEVPATTAVAETALDDTLAIEEVIAPSTGERESGRQTTDELPVTTSIQDSTITKVASEATAQEPPAPTLSYPESTVEIVDKAASGQAIHTPGTVDATSTSAKPIIDFIEKGEASPTAEASLHAEGPDPTTKNVEEEGSGTTTIENAMTGEHSAETKATVPSPASSQILDALPDISTEPEPETSLPAASLVAEDAPEVSAESVPETGSSFPAVASTTQSTNEPVQVDASVQIVEPVAETASDVTPAQVAEVQSGPTENEELDDGTKTPGSVGTTVEETSSVADPAPKTSAPSKKKKKKKGKK